ncbi:MAG: CcoQ/FixQ family Cbb3-type cytochrome c oxidase assembly chaperone [Candidatus Kapabacteria bacterium]|nr:CcoQ/FixQ family Cbb3-type cytochrome c oxidase assembly chaperone [Candidatus Kapabacteria bacterium]
MKFKFYLESIAGIDILPMISLLFFFAFFIAMTVYVVTMKKELVDEISNLPLNDSDVNKFVSK